jgi:hypothetical protein
MKHASISAALLAIVAIAAYWQSRPVQSATAMDEHHPAAATPAFTASSERTFNQLMDEAMGVMHQGMHGAARTGDPDRDFVNLLISHHRGAIDMAKTLLLYGKDEQLKRLAQEIIADQQNEIQLMRLWLSQHGLAVNFVKPIRLVGFAGESTKTSSYSRAAAPSRRRSDRSERSWPQAMPPASSLSGAI